MSDYLPTMQAYCTTSISFNCPPPHGSDCTLCERSLSHDLRSNPILRISCGCYHHETCLTFWWRGAFDRGTCPSCSTMLFRKGPTDRIKETKGAIFGSKCTPLCQIFEIDGADDHQVHVSDEESLAAAQLDVLADILCDPTQDAWDDFMQTGSLPDWRAVVQDIIAAFRRAGMPVPQCGYLPDNDVFLKCLVTAMLGHISLRNMSHITSPSVLTAFRRTHGYDLPVTYAFNGLQATALRAKIDFRNEHEHRRDWKWTYIAKDVGETYWEWTKPMREHSPLYGAHFRILRPKASEYGYDEDGSGRGGYEDESLPRDPPRGGPSFNNPWLASGQYPEGYGYGRR